MRCIGCSLRLKSGVLGEPARRDIEADAEVHLFLTLLNLYHDASAARGCVDSHDIIEIVSGMSA